MIAIGDAMCASSLRVRRTAIKTQMVKESVVNVSLHRRQWLPAR